MQTARAFLHPGNVKRSAAKDQERARRKQRARIQERQTARAGISGKGSAAGTSGAVAVSSSWAKDQHGTLSAAKDQERARMKQRARNQERQTARAGISGKGSAAKDQERHGLGILNGRGHYPQPRRPRRTQGQVSVAASVRAFQSTPFMFQKCRF